MLHTFLPASLTQIAANHLPALLSRLEDLIFGRSAVVSMMLLNDMGPLLVQLFIYQFARRFAGRLRIIELAAEDATVCSECVSQPPVRFIIQSWQVLSLQVTGILSLQVRGLAGLILCL
jgi:hypothetical protein